jgi:hypothetical protein
MNSDTLWPMVRAATSGWPPAASGTTMRIGFAGTCENAWLATSSSNPQAVTPENVVYPFWFVYAASRARS